MSTERWAAKGSETTLAVWVVDQDGKRVCNVCDHNFDWDRARLIAAAPRLLYALEELMTAVSLKVEGAERFKVMQEAAGAAREAKGR